MSSRFLFFIFTFTSALNLIACGDGHHHVIIHVPYKIHTIHHTITKHIHHHDQSNGDKYEVIGYTIGKPINVGHHFGTGHEEVMTHHDFGSNELGNGWVPSYGQQQLAIGPRGQIDDHVDIVPVHEFSEHGGSGNYGSYD